MLLHLRVEVEKETKGLLGDKRLMIKFIESLVTAFLSQFNKVKSLKTTKQTNGTLSESFANVPS